VLHITNRAEVGEHNFGELMFVRVTDYGGYAGQGGDFLGSALGIASGDNNSCQRVLALDAADGGAGVPIGGIGDGAGVQNDEVGLGGGGAGEGAGFELTIEGGAVGLGGAASEVFDVVGEHGAMVAQAGQRTRRILAGRLPLQRRVHGRCVPPGESRKRSGGGGDFLLREAFAAEDGATLCGAEGDGGLLAALGAGGPSFDARALMSVARRRRGAEDSHTLGLAGFTALGFVLEPFIVEKQLFSGGKNKLGAAVDAG
jgi:hypothetical protein